MNKIHNTTSICEHCYRHVPAVLFERDNSIWLSKKCKWHGESEYLVEPNAEFYINYTHPTPGNTTYCLDITNRCNLKCPHCYQITDNTSKDPSIDHIIEIVK